MKQETDIDRILNEYCNQDNSYESLRQWVEDTFIELATKSDKFDIFDIYPPKKHRKCWIVFNEFGRNFLVSKTDHLYHPSENKVVLKMDDYIYGSLFNPAYSGSVLTRSEIKKVAKEMASDMDRWCLLLTINDQDDQKQPKA